MSQEERISDSPLETLQKALGLHFISKRGPACLWQIQSHVEFTAWNVDDAWQFFNIVRNPNITVSNRKRFLNSHLTSRSVRIVLSRRVYIPEFPSYLDRCRDFTEKTPVSNGRPRRNSRIYPRFLPQLEKTHETSPSPHDEARFPCISCWGVPCSQSKT